MKPGKIAQPMRVALTGGTKSPEELVALLKPFLAIRNYPEKPDSFIAGAVRTLQARSRTLVEMADAMRFYMVDEIEFDPDAAAKFLTGEIREAFEGLISDLHELDHFDEKTLEPVFRKIAEDSGMKLGKIAQPVRVALTGETKSPGLFEIMEVLGKQTVLERLQKGLTYIRKNSGITN